MKGLNETAQYLSNSFGDDLGAGKSKTSKHRHKHIVRARLRRLNKWFIENKE